MLHLDLDEPADLTIWPSGPDCAKAVEPVAFPTLRAALSAAALALEDPHLDPWILTASGLILTPDWLQGHFAGRDRA
ncbi:hypothetical protein OPKNFCMD_0013 [Methylobacterium crusticola]|uniref:Uncharacterized protein n=1 Tax=Methylobacterium crusticola TaxID=1697972 RepID=A0ABQ4QPV5_9HYPH|nr:hypothetical protein [Methylobacterium crusticola]GJD47307.1 hypothetical protein OPKNFCMD_0013 [Methylobacterium crusticola]